MEEDYTKDLRLDSFLIRKAYSAIKVRRSCDLRMLHNVYSALVG